MRSLAILTILFGMVVSVGISAAAEPPIMTVWKNPSCGCCGKWVEHMRTAGFTLKVKEDENLTAVKRMAGIPDHLQSCHTARIGKYVIEGHVPASDVKRFLKMKPEGLGLVVPGMPSGSPGMENGEHDPYDVLLLKKDGTTEVFSSHK